MGAVRRLGTVYRGGECDLRWPRGEPAGAAPRQGGVKHWRGAGGDGDLGESHVLGREAGTRESVPGG